MFYNKKFHKSWVLLLRIEAIDTSYVCRAGWKTWGGNRHYTATQQERIKEKQGLKSSPSTVCSCGNGS